MFAIFVSQVTEEPVKNESYSYNNLPFESGPQWRELVLNLQPFHYQNGQINLRCNAEIPDIFYKVGELQLSSDLGEPQAKKGN